jgi:hypothetical protein
MMHTLPPQVFANVSPAKFAAIEATAEHACGIPIRGASGTAKGPYGIVITWKYDEATETLTTQCLDHAFYVPDTTVEQRMQDLVANTHEATTLETALIHQPIVHTGIRAIKRDSRTLQIRRYRTVIGKEPVASDWTGNVVDWGMMLNDQLGCCTIAGVGHWLQAVTHAAQGQMITVGDDIIRRYYSLWDGYVPGNPRTDRGGVELDVLNYWRKSGFAGHKLVAHAEADPRDAEECADALAEFGPLYVGMEFPERLAAHGKPDPAIPWALDPRPGPVGGHCVIVVGKLPNNGNWKIVSWGSVYELTPDFFAKQMTEVHVLIGQDFVGPTGKTPSGYDLTKLQQDLANIR